MSGAFKLPETRQRLKGPNLEEFAKFASAPFEEALRRADAEGRVIASNARVDRALVGSEEWKTIKEAFACWTGTIVAYTEPRKPFGNIIEYKDEALNHRWVLSVPEKHRGERDCALVAEHPYFTLEVDGNNRVVHAVRLALLSGFPACDGWYRGDPVHGIPVGSKADNPASDLNARFLMRTDKRVGPVARRAHSSGYDGKVVHLHIRPSLSLGAAAESPAPGTPKVSSTEPDFERYGRDIATEIGNFCVVFHVTSMHSALETVAKQARIHIDDLVSGFQWYGLDRKPLREASDMLGAFVMKELPEYPHLQGLVLELRKYYAQKLREVLE